MRGMDLYRLYDAEGALLYIGISYSAIARYAQHKETQPWIGLVARIEVEPLGDVDRREAQRLERQAIHAQKPKHNVVHNGRTARFPSVAIQRQLSREEAVTKTTADLYQSIPLELRRSELMQQLVGVISDIYNEYGEHFEVDQAVGMFRAVSATCTIADCCRDDDCDGRRMFRPVVPYEMSASGSYLTCSYECPNCLRHWQTTWGAMMLNSHFVGGNWTALWLG